MAWENPDVGIELAREGWATRWSAKSDPGQAYYLDMVQAEAFQEPVPAGREWCRRPTHMAMRPRAISPKSR